MLTLVTMAAEIAAGWAFNSMALLADGWHMGTHAFALGLAAFAYAYARRHAADPRFAFGVWKVEALGGFTSALMLLLVAAAMAQESAQRLINPLPISFGQAIVVAVLGLAVNLLCALILQRSGSHSHVHSPHDAGVGGAAPTTAADLAPPDHHAHHHDLNLRSAYVHVLTDAATSVLAIVALLGGLWLGWQWLDPLMGIVGAILVALWARSLLRESSKVLLDAEMDSPAALAIRRTLEGLTVTRLHVLRVGHQRYVCLLSVGDDEVPEARRRLATVPGIVLLYVDNLQKKGGGAA